MGGRKPGLNSTKECSTAFSRGKVAAIKTLGAMDKATDKIPFALMQRAMHKSSQSKFDLGQLLALPLILSEAI